MCKAWWPHGQCTRPWIERSGFEPWPGTLCCVLGQGTLLSQCLSPPRSINGYLRIVGENLTNCWGVTCDRLASHPEGVEKLLAASCYGNWDMLRPDESQLAQKGFTIRKHNYSTHLHSDELIGTEDSSDSECS